MQGPSHTQAIQANDEATTVKISYGRYVHVHRLVSTWVARKLQVSLNNTFPSHYEYTSAQLHQNIHAEKTQSRIIKVVLTVCQLHVIQSLYSENYGRQIVNDCETAADLIDGLIIKSCNEHLKPCTKHCTATDMVIFISSPRARNLTHMRNYTPTPQPPSIYRATLKTTRMFALNRQFIR